MIPGMPFDDPIEAIQYARALEGRGAEGTKMKRTTDKHHSNRVRQQARRLAKKLDCSVCAHRLRGQEYNYYVYGAPSLYGDGTAPGIREDVHEGNNRLGDWDEVLERLESYQVDIWLYTRGVSASLSWEIQTKAPRHLLTAWINGDMTAGMALADMFSEGGEEVLSGTIREALQHQPEMP